MYRRLTSIAVFCLLLSTGIAGADDKKKKDKFEESYDAFAVVMGTASAPMVPTGRSNVLQIHITRWTTDEERAELFNALAEGGQDALIKAMRKQEETGWARATKQTRNPFPSTRLYYAREFPNEDGSRRIVLASDRYISFAESMSNPRWRDHDMSLIVMDIPAEGDGEGQLAMAVQLSLDTENGKLVVENYGTEPVRLTKIVRRK